MDNVNQIDDTIEVIEHYGIKRRSGRYPWGSGKNPYQHQGDSRGSLTTVTGIPGGTGAWIANEGSGIKRRTGEYPWAGKDYDATGWLKMIDEKIKDPNYKYVDSSGKVYTGQMAVCKEFNISTTDFRAYKSVAKSEKKRAEIIRAHQLQEEGYSLREIAAQMGYQNDSSVRNLLKEGAAEKNDMTMNVANFLKQQVDEKGIIDVSSGVEIGDSISRVANSPMGISQEKFNQALSIAEGDGYKIYNARMRQATNKGQINNTLVLCPPGTEYGDIYKEEIHTIDDYIYDHDIRDVRPRSAYPAAIDVKRVAINHADDTWSDEPGIKRDGLIEIRPGCKDLDLGDSKYAQVRILVDNGTYIKGMAVYGDPNKFPPGKDIIFNTNKSKDKPIEEVLKPIKEGDNPFGATIKPLEDGGQYYYIGDDGQKHLGLINKKSDEGDWAHWSKTLPAQFLSKQPLKLIQQQLELTKTETAAEFDSICALEHPTVKRAILETFASQCDSKSVSLDAAAFRRQQYNVIIPIPELSDDEVYDPSLSNGEQVALIRFPHASTSEIPILKVNNKVQAAVDIIGKNPMDAIGINSNVAERMSGADFDGDFVLTIPITATSNIRNAKPFQGLIGFDPKEAYPEREGMVYMKNPKTGKDNTEREMGIITNLIADMTIAGADEEELTRAIKHSMCVIDAKKHKLDYKRSELENGIAELHAIYQGHIDPEDGHYHEGAGTIITRAGSEKRVTRRKGSPKIDEKTGNLIYKEAPESEQYYVGKDGKTHRRFSKTTKMEATDDATTLISKYDSPVEHVYADYANFQKDYARKARLEILKTGRQQVDREARAKYAAERASLLAQLNESEKNAPREREANRLANEAAKERIANQPELTEGDKKKIRQQELTAAREKVGAHRTPIVITDREWEAIKAGALSDSDLIEIFNHCDMDELRKRATPRSTKTIADSVKQHAKALANAGYTTAEIAKRLGISASSVNNIIRDL